MNKLKELVDERLKKLRKIVRSKEKALKKAPKGVLNIHSSNGRTQYYYKETSNDKKRMYIKENEKKLVKDLCQKEYDQKVLVTARQELKVLEKLQKTYQKTTCEELYGQLHIQRQSFVIPIEIPDDEYIQNWQEETYEGKGFPIGYPEYYTDKGERVRSKSEIIIANILNKYGVPYKYEHPLYLKEYLTMYPDFTVLNVCTRKEIYFEHFGMMDDPQYAEIAINKIETYAKNGIFIGDNLIATFESKQKPLNQKMVEMMIKKYFL